MLEVAVIERLLVASVGEPTTKQALESAQVKGEEAGPALDAADDADAFGEIDLRMSLRMLQRHNISDLQREPATGPFRSRVAREAIFVSKPSTICFADAASLLERRPVLEENSVDHR